MQNLTMELKNFEINEKVKISIERLCRSALTLAVDAPLFVILHVPLLQLINCSDLYPRPTGSIVQGPCGGRGHIRSYGSDSGQHHAQDRVRSHHT